MLIQFKIVLTQLSCIGKGVFKEHFTQYKLELVRERVFNIWRMGSGERKWITTTVNGIDLALLENEVVLQNQFESNNDLAIFRRQMLATLPLSKLSSDEFNRTYRELDEFIVRFFSMRKVTAEAAMVS